MYKVTCLYNGTTYTLHDPLSDTLRIYNDQLETETNKPGSFQFTVSYDHPYLDKIVGLSSDIRVYDDTEEIWRGRPIDDGEDLYRARTFKCEGELAFLYDSIQPRRELHGITPLQFLTLLLNEHNAQVKGKGPIDKTFLVGTVTVVDSNNSLYRYTNRETTLDAIGEKLINRLGGYLHVRTSGSNRYIDLLADVETISDQPIQLGENLLNYTRDTDYTQIATACIPLGAALETTEIAALDAYLTCAEANNGSDTIQLDDAVKKYGFICKVLNFSETTVPANLKKSGEEWLKDGQYEQMTLDLTAVDLHTLGYDLQPIRVNSQVRVISTPHGMDRFFEVSKRTYHLTQPETDTVTFGKTESQKSYTSSSSKKVSDVNQHAEQLRQNIDSVIAKERENTSNILSQATHGYVVMDPNSGPERILVMDTNNIDTAKKIWKWDMNGFGYSNKGIGGPWGIAITMNGQISADYITTGELDASLIKVGKIQDVKGSNFWNMETGEFSLSASAKVGGKTVSEIATNAVDAQTQDDIFKKLTGGGSTQGIYLSGGKVYINATYIATGTLKDTGENVVLNLSTGSLTMKKGSINIGNGVFQVTTTGALTANSATIRGTIYSGSDKGYWTRLNTSGQMEGGYGSTTYGYIDYSAASTDLTTQQVRNGIQMKAGIFRIATDRIAVYRGTDVSQTATLCGTGKVEYISKIENKEDGGLTWYINSISFTNGLLTSWLD